MEDKTSLVLTVLVHFNSPQDCCLIVNDLEMVDYSNHQIVVVDNRSNIKEYEELESLLKRTSAVLIKNNFNNGYGGGINYGVKYGAKFKPDFIHVLNTDTRITNFSYLSGLVKKLSADPKSGVIGPAVKSAQGGIQNTIMPFVTIKNQVSFRKNFSSLSTIQTVPELKEAQVLNGVCFLVKYEVFKKVEGFDEDFFMYGEEQDFCYRVSKAGYQNYFLSSESIIHYEKSNHFEVIELIDWKYMLVRSNQVMYLRKNRSSIEGTVSAFMFLGSTIKKIFSGSKLQNLSFWRVLEALFCPEKFNRSFVKP